MNPMDAPRLFSMIDRDRSGRISGKYLAKKILFAKRAIN